MKASLATSVILILASLPGVCTAQGGANANYPTKPIRLIVPQAPGGSNDVFARYIGSLLSERVGAQVITILSLTTWFTWWRKLLIRKWKYFEMTRYHWKK